MPGLPQEPAGSADQGLVTAEPLSTRPHDAGGDGDGEVGIRTYDFRRPTKLSRDHVRILEVQFDTFARQWTTLLTTSLRAVSSATLKGVQQLTYDEYVSTLPMPTTMFILAVDPLPGAGILEFSLSSAMTMVDHLLGGPGRPPQPQRPFTEIETTLLRGVIERILHELHYAIETLVPMESSIVGIEHNPQFAQAASPSDLVLVTTFDLKIGVDECQASVVLPFNGMLPYLEKAVHGATSGRERGDREAVHAVVSTRMADVGVEVNVAFTPTPVRMEDVVALKIGDVIRLRHPVSLPLAVTSAGVGFAHCVPGREGTRLACLVVKPPEVQP
jgi:flagellar motor switch protein FliM